MPFDPTDFAVDAQLGLICWWPRGPLGPTEVIEQFQHLHRVERRASYRRFVDLSQATPGAGASFEAVAALGQIAQAQLVIDPGLKFAMFSAHPVGYGFARMYASVLDETPFDVDVFDDLERAASFLAVPPGALRRRAT